MSDVTAEFDNHILSILALLTRKESATADAIAYVAWKRTGKHFDEQIKTSLERLYEAGKLYREKNIRQEWAYWGRK